MDDVIQNTQSHMQKVLEVIKNDLSTVRAGKATPSLVEHILINAYGGTQKLKIIELAQISATDSQTIVITPYDASIIGEIHKGIQEGNVGLTPVIDGQLIRISIPPLSEERRKDLIALVHQKLEAGKVQVRQVRHEAMDNIKKSFEKKEISEDDKARFEKEVQKITDEEVASIETLGKKKEEELLQI